MKKTIVVSAIALRSGGTFSILEDCLQELSHSKYSDFSIHALVKDVNLLPTIHPTINFIELDGTGSYVKRLYYEYFYFNKLSKKLKPDLWFSLHDITPNVKAKQQVVYCHNPSPFFKISVKEFLLDPKFGFFTFLYWLLYRVNIKKNNYVIVQQDWLREKFSELFGVGKEKIIVAHPSISISLPDSEGMSGKNIFFFPTLPRVFKNIELIGEAVKILSKKNITSFQVIITVEGNENRYAKWIKKKYGHLPALNFIGEQPRKMVFELYSKVNYLLFPSRLETWGLPISEFKNTGKFILISDLPYAHETLGDYDKSIFFDSTSGKDLADKMENLILKKQSILNVPHQAKKTSPTAKNWAELFQIILPF